ncbi:hypothetical protein ACIPZF_16180 [Pseudomonas sp. NPDC089752]|uniref:hypothetical protein n=1 Tax=Pseudomonas sp. NPDC089752 TaxID=3364472 RepID=UPI003822B4A0
MFYKLEQAGAGSRFVLSDVLSQVPWSSQGLVAAIALQHDSGEVLMLDEVVVTDNQGEALA